MKRLLLLIAGIATALIGLEALFRALPVYTIPERGALPGEPSLQTWKPGATLLYSRGLFLEHPVRHEANTLGLINGGTPDTARAVWIQGDSYVEAQTHAYENTLQGRLAARLRGNGIAVAALSSSGGGFADYLNGVRAANRLTRSPLHVVVVSPNDYTESFAFGNEAGGSQNVLRVLPNGSLRVEPGRRRHARAREWLKRSALMRYVFLNLQFQPAMLWNRDAADRSPRGGTPPEDPHLPGSHARFYDRAAGALLDSLRAAAAGHPLLLVLDCNRDRLARRYLGGSAGAAREDSAAPGDDLKEQFARLAAARGMQTLDLCRDFSAWMAKHGRALDMRPADTHWNEDGHAVAAEAIHRRLIDNGWIPIP